MRIFLPMCGDAGARGRMGFFGDRVCVSHDLLGLVSRGVGEDAEPLACYRFDHGGFVRGLFFGHVAVAFGVGCGPCSFAGIVGYLLDVFASAAGNGNRGDCDKEGGARERF